MVSSLLGAGPVMACNEGSCARLQVLGRVAPATSGDCRAWLKPRFAGWHDACLHCDSGLAGLALELRVRDSLGRCIHRLVPACAAGREQFYRLLDELVESPAMPARVAPRSACQTRDDGASARLAGIDAFPGQPPLGRLKGPWRDVLRLGCSDACTRLPVESLLALLRACVQRRVNLALCVTNAAMAQGSAMLPTQLQRDGGGWTLTGRCAQLQLLDNRVAEVWLVRCAQGSESISFVDVLDRSGALVLRLRGRPKPGLSEPADWRRLVGEFRALRAQGQPCP